MPEAAWHEKGAERCVGPCLFRSFSMVFYCSSWFLMQFHGDTARMHHSRASELHLWSLHLGDHEEQASEGSLLMAPTARGPPFRAQWAYKLQKTPPKWFKKIQQSMKMASSALFGRPRTSILLMHSAQEGYSNRAARSIARRKTAARQRRSFGHCLRPTTF